MTKVSIIGGAGTLGSATAFNIAQLQQVDEVLLIDANKSLLLNHVMDLQNAFPYKKIIYGELEDVVGSNIVLITAGVPNHNDISSRNEFLTGNIKIFSDLGKKLIDHSPDALIVTASNPVDILNLYLYQCFGFDRRQLIGYTMNDSYRFNWAVRRTLSLKNEDRLITPVIGEHGSTQVPLFSQSCLNGEPLYVSSEERQKIISCIKDWFGEFNRLGANRTTGWTTAAGIRFVIEKLINTEPAHIIGSAILEGEYGINDVSIGVPLTVNNGGIQQIEEWPLIPTERNDFLESVRNIKHIIENINIPNVIN